MSKFTDDVILKILRGTCRYELVQEFNYYREENKDSLINVPKGLVTDLASVPRIFWNIIPPNGPYTKPAILHDYLCNMNTLTRELEKGKQDGSKIINGVSLPNKSHFLVWDKEVSKDVVISRKRCDRIFLESMLSTNCGKFRSYLMYSFVRLYAIVTRKK